MAGTTVSKRLSNKIQENRALIDQAKLDRDKILELGDKISGLQNQLGEEEAKVKKWELMQQKGYTAVTINDGIITHATNVLPYSTFTYTQNIPNEINTALYQRFPFYILDNTMAIKIDTQKFMRYKSI